jgi:hypothetical protein
MEHFDHLLSFVGISRKPQQQSNFNDNCASLFATMEMCIKNNKSSTRNEFPHPMNETNEVKFDFTKCPQFDKFYTDEYSNVHLQYRIRDMHYLRNRRYSVEVSKYGLFGVLVKIELQH